MNKNAIKPYIRTALYKLHHRKHEKFYKQVMAMNNIANAPVQGEQEWIKKWSMGGAIPTPTQYRVFSKYIGADINIVPEDICHDYIEPILDPFRYVGYYADKNIFDKLFPAGYFPMTIVRKMNGFWYDADYKKLDMIEDMLKSYLSQSDKLIIKPSVDGMSGRGIQLFTIQPDGTFKTNQGEIVTLDFINKNFGRDFIIQEAVKQSDYINQFNPTSVNTLRLSVYRSVKDDNCHVTGAIMRIGGKGSVVDNAHAGGCYVGIHSDGTFCHEVLDQYGQKRTSFNDVDFANDYKYPNWERVIEFAKSVGQYVPHHRLLALDIVLDKDNEPHLIEFNVLYYSSWLFQYTTCSAFGIYTDEILEYCKAHQNELEYQIML